MTGGSVFAAASHAAHSLTFALPALAVLGTWWTFELDVRRNGYPSREWVRSAPQSPDATDALLAAAALSLCAAGIHAAVTGDHFDEANAAGVFFVVVTAAQTLWPAWALARPSRTTLFAGAAGNAAVAVVWALSRTVGVWNGTAVEVEHAGLLDSISTVFEVVIAACCVVVLSRRGLRRPLRLLTGTLRAPAVATAAAVLTAVALLASR
jgi:hypothetical protein